MAALKLRNGTAAELGANCKMAAVILVETADAAIVFAPNNERLRGRCESKIP